MLKNIKSYNMIKGLFYKWQVNCVSQNPGLCSGWIFSQIQSYFEIGLDVLQKTAILSSHIQDSTC